MGLMERVAQAEAAADELELKTEAEQEERFLNYQKERRAEVAAEHQRETQAHRERLAQTAAEAVNLKSQAEAEAAQELTSLQEKAGVRAEGLIDVVKEILLR